jgi:hypothetical protein
LRAQHFASEQRLRLHPIFSQEKSKFTARGLLRESEALSISRLVLQRLAPFQKVQRLLQQAPIV